MISSYSILLSEMFRLRKRKRKRKSGQLRGNQGRNDSLICIIQQDPISISSSRKAFVKKKFNDNETHVCDGKGTNLEKIKKVSRHGSRSLRTSDRCESRLCMG